MARIAFLLILALLTGCSVLRAANPLRVACVGDSITAGTVLPSAKTESYPALLKRKLGAAVDVRNFGHSGATVTAEGEGALPYRNLPEYKEVLAFRPHVVIVMLGTNDAKKPIWSSQRKNFGGNYKALIGSFLALRKPPRIILCRPVPVLGTGRFKITEKNRVEVVGALKKVAKELDLKLEDFDPSLRGKDSLYSDPVHPNAAGTAVIATQLESLLRRLVSLP